MLDYRMVINKIYLSLRCLLVAALLITTDCHATDLDIEGREMFKILHDEQGWPLPKEYPQYTLGITDDAPLVCKKSGRACYSNGRIWISRELLDNDMMRKSVILHENVHHLQQEKSGPAVTCIQNWKREIDAYHAQQTYLSDHYRIFLGLTVSIFCVPE